MYLLVMPKYWRKQIFTYGSFPEVSQKQKTEERERKKEGKVITMASYGLQRHLVWFFHNHLVLIDLIAVYLEGLVDS